MTGPVDIIREALTDRYVFDREGALAALTELEHQLAACRCGARAGADVLLSVDEWERLRAAETALADATREVEHVRAKYDRRTQELNAAEQRANELADALRWAIDEPNLGALIRDKQQYEWWRSRIVARAALDRHTPPATDEQIDRSFDAHR